MKVTSATDREVVAALSILFQLEANTQGAVAAASSMFSSGAWSLSDLLVAKTGDSVIGAILARSMAGSTGVILPAQAINGISEVEDTLTAAALARLSTSKVVQSFLNAGGEPAAGSLLRVGFQRTTRLNLMYRPATTILHPVDFRQLRIVPYTDVDPRLFRDVFEKCLENSLDCPELHTVLDVDETLSGYRECAPDTNAWWIARNDRGAVGTLVMNGNTLAFVGVKAEHRGRGIGRALVAFACKNSPELSLVVDSRNAPAIQLYESMGFQAFSAREVFLKFQKV